MEKEFHFTDDLPESEPFADDIVQGQVEALLAARQDALATAEALLNFEPPGGREPDLLARERAVLARLVSLARERSAEERYLLEETARRQSDAESAAETNRQQADAAVAQALKRAADAHVAEQRETEHGFRRNYAGTKREYFAVRRKALEQFNRQREVALKQREEARWSANAVYEAAKQKAKQQFTLGRRQLHLALHALRLAGVEARQALVRLRQPEALELAAAQEPASEVDVVGSLDAIGQSTAVARAALETLRSLKLPKCFIGGAPLIWQALIWLSPVYFYINLLGVPIGLAASFISGVLLGSATYGLLYWLSARSVGKACLPLLRALNLGEMQGQAAWQELVVEFGRERSRIKGLRKQEQLRTAEICKRATEQARAERDRALAAATATYPPRGARLRTERAQRLAELVRQREAAEAAARKAHANAHAAAEQNWKTAVADLHEWREMRWMAMAMNWQQGVREAEAEIESIREECVRLFPGWATAKPVQTAAPKVLQFGMHALDCSRIPDWQPTDEPLRADLPVKLSLPALAPFPEGASLLLRCVGEGRLAATEALQAAVLRLLLSVPAGKLRLTIVDPVGLGQNFAGLMHLADYDENLVSRKIWTEATQIEQRLADMTEQMETVIQKYLRNEFKTLEEYNAQAGEIAEPYRVLVVANFPVGFTEAAARRLLSIAATGKPCGVLTLVSVDLTQPLPNGVSLADLERHSCVFSHHGGEFVRHDPQLGLLPLAWEQSPSAERTKSLLRSVGESALASQRVEVPFECIVPQKGQYWQASTQGSVDVPLGRAGATRLQWLRLGQGTSQHVLIAGKTGSGKSTLLHALIVSSALRYSPDELQLYLIDFKKGVEFKDYAQYALPHARVVAIASEREFGLSVLQRLDHELTLRGNTFRTLGVQDLPGYRRLADQPPLPRILLVVDEFQELFVEDDRLAQDAALLLDRLVRQGRAFGVHVLLGSQTLGGAYSLARSTLGQMAVRIALQCSEADAHLILSEENTAARLLGRPGEAIYNDANGRLEGNHPFQVVWLSDSQREDYLQQIQSLATAGGRAGIEPAIVFEGNRAADLEHNRALTALLAGDAAPAESAVAWLGEPVAIKDPTSVAFARQSGSNLLILGSDVPLARGVLGSALVALGAQTTGAAGGASLYLCDGGVARGSDDSTYSPLVAALGSVCTLTGWRDIASVLLQVATEVQRRIESGETQAPPLYLALSDLSRFRELRKQEDDFSFSRGDSDRPPSPDKLLATILTEGPRVGVYTLCWCDSLANLNRTFDRQTLREFELRVLLQMSANDSTQLIDTPAASKLGTNRALWCNEQQGVLEKFRPYGLPGAALLERLASATSKLSRSAALPSA